MIRYISDLHFGHRNILMYDDRPFNSVDEMEEAMTSLWNETVKPGDTTYILGDVVWNAEPKEWKRILTALNGKKIVVKGNHDPTERLKRMKRDGIIEDWAHQLVVKDNGRSVVLNHSPMPFFVNQHKEDWYHLYGHVHLSYDYQTILYVRKAIEDLYLHPHRMYNVGCMVRGIDYIPRTLDEIVEADAKFRNAPYDFKEKHGKKA